MSNKVLWLYHKTGYYCTGLGANFRKDLFKEYPFSFVRHCKIRRLPNLYVVTTYARNPLAKHGYKRIDRQYCFDLKLAHAYASKQLRKLRKESGGKVKEISDKFVREYAWRVLVNNNKCYLVEIANTLHFAFHPIFKFDKYNQK